MSLSIPRFCVSFIATILFALTSSASWQAVNYGVAHGLSDGCVKSIAQDGRGYIWIATDYGLNRYEGDGFRRFEKCNSALPANELNYIAPDSYNCDILWIATQRKGLCKYDHAAGQIFPASEKLSNLTAVTHILPAADGGMWFVDYHQGIYYYNERKDELKIYNHTTVKNIPRSRYWCMAIGNDGKLYVGQNQSGMSVVDTLTMTARLFSHGTSGDILPGHNIYSICIDHNDNIWVGTENGAALVNPATFSVVAFRHDSSRPHSIGGGRIREIREMDNNEIWFATSEDGVSILDLKNLPFTGMKDSHFTRLPGDMPGKGSSSRYTQSLLQDSFGNIWIGNYRSGVDVIDHLPSLFERIDYIDNGPRPQHNAVWSCAYHPDSGLWLGGEGEIANHKDHTIIKTVKIPHDYTKSHGLVLAMTFDRNGNLWIGTTTQEIWMFTPSTSLFKKIASIHGQVNSFAIHDGKLWIGTENGLMSCDLSTHKMSAEEKYNEQLSDRVVRNIKFDNSGKMWVGTFGQGLDVFGPDGNKECNICLYNGFISNAVTSMFLDSKGRIWAATRSGAAIFPDTSNPTKWEKVEGLNDSHIKDIREDVTGLFWISTNHGLAVYNADSRHIRAYESSPGFPLNSFFDAASSYYGDSLLCFGSSNGAFVADPTVLGLTTVDTHPRITSFIARGDRAKNIEDVDLMPLIDNRKIKLSHNRNNFEISFFSGDHALQRRVDYAYRLKGYDDRWVETTGNNRALFPNIPSGKYMFEVKSRIKGEDWGKPECLLNIIIPPPFWLTWWAICIYIICIILIIIGLLKFLFHRHRLQALLQAEKQRNKAYSQLNEERLRFYTNITHELRTPLSLIIGPIEDLAGDKEMPAKYVKKLSLIRESSRQLLGLINDILEFRKTETHNRRLSVERGKLNNLIREIGLRYRELNRKPDVKINLDIQYDAPEVYYDKDLIESVVNNLMNNAVKYTDSGTITLSYRLITQRSQESSPEETFIEIKVADTGYGIPADKLPHIFERYYQANGSHQVSGTGIGLALTKSLVELHQGVVSVVSEVGKGSVFSVFLKADNLYPQAIHKESTGRVAREAASEFQQEPPEEKRIKILVVEDNAQLLEYINQVLSDEYDVLTATNGAEGLEMVREEMPDLIVSDIMMPQMDGIQMCAAIKGNIDTSHIPLILLTAKDSLSDRQAGYEAGADSFIPKPFSGQLLLTRIHNMLKARKNLSDLILTGRLFDPVATPDATDETEETLGSEKPVNEEVKTALSPLDRQFLERLTTEINRNIDNPDLSVVFLADHLNMSQPTLYRKTTAILGISAQEYVRHLRIEKAKELLRQGLMTVSQIAIATGFKSHVSFGKAFKKETDMTPTEFIKEQNHTQ